ncbi:MAG: 50S ribosomal protein L10 [Hyphomicrobiaceae bacterium]
MERAEKHEFVKSLNGSFNDAGVIVVAHYSGLTVAEMTDLRNQMKDAGATVKVAKNRLAKLALKDTPAEGIGELFTGPTCVVTSEDPVSGPKIAVEFSKKNDKLVILGGAMGETVLDVAAVKSLAALPSLDELRGKIVGLLQAPAGKIARILNEPGGQLARVLQAKADAG